MRGSLFFTHFLYPSSLPIIFNRKPFQIFAGEHVELFFETGTEIFGIVESYAVCQFGYPDVLRFLHNFAGGFQSDVADESRGVEPGE